jgi:hypothetical protein
MNHLHLGQKKAFGSYKLIWVDDVGDTHVETISKKLFDALYNSGMGTEG